MIDVKAAHKELEAHRATIRELTESFLQNPTEIKAKQLSAANAAFQKWKISLLVRNVDATDDVYQQIEDFMNYEVFTADTSIPLDEFKQKLGTGFLRELEKLYDRSHADVAIRSWFQEPDESATK
jgi:hypothetical protein